MPDPNQPQLTAEEQASRDELAARKQYLREILSLVEPFQWDEILEQLAKFEGVAEKAVKGDIRKDREWAEKFIDVNIRGPRLHETNFDGLLQTMEPLPVPGPKGGGQQPAGYPPEHERYPENIVYQHTDNHSYIKKGGNLYRVDPDGTIRNKDGWPVGTYNSATKEIHWQETPNYPPKGILYARKLLKECEEAMNTIARATEEQETQLNAIKHVADDIIQLERDVIAIIDRMKNAYKTHRGRAKNAKDQGLEYPPLGKSLFVAANELAGIGDKIKASAHPLDNYLKLLETSKLDAALIHRLTERVKVLDNVSHSLPMREAVFGQLEDEPKRLLTRLNITDVQGLVKHLEDSVHRQIRFSEDMAKTNIHSLYDLVAGYEAIIKMLVDAIRRGTKSLCNYDEPDLTTALTVDYAGQPLLNVIVTTAQEIIAILVNVEKIEDKIRDEIHGDRVALVVVGKSLASLQQALTEAENQRRGSPQAA